MDSNRQNELKKIADGIRAGALTTSNMVAPENMLNVFRAMCGVTLGELENWEKDGIHLIYEWNKNAAGGDDGNPVFDSYRRLSTEDCRFIDEEVARLDEAAKERNIRNVRKRKKRKSRQ